jgi:hypothetical protein
MKKLAYSPVQRHSAQAMIGPTPNLPTNLFSDPTIIALPGRERRCAESHEPVEDGKDGKRGELLWNRGLGHPAGQRMTAAKGLNNLKSLKSLNMWRTREGKFFADRDPATGSPGARRVRCLENDPDESHWIMADPEGNALCCVRPL